MQDLDRCINCGLCHGICPVYLTTGEESTSARGKINLLRAIYEGEIRPNAHLVHIFNRCLLCYGCQSVCPSGVLTENLWITSREFLARQVGQSLAKKLAFQGFLGKPGLLKIALNVLRAVQSLIFPKGIQYKHLRTGLTIPKLSSKTLLEYLPERVPATCDPPVGRVGYFVGCMSNYLLPDIAYATISVLSKLGYEVVIPHQQLCCGAPAFNNGDFKTARKLAQWNINVFLDAGVDMVVSADGTCGGAFTHEYEKLFGEDDPKYKEFKMRCSELLTLIAKRLESMQPKRTPIPTSVTIHDSCHVTHTQGITDAPRQLMQAIPGVDITEKVRSDHCCGFGGSFNVMFPDIANEITALRVNEMTKTDAQVVVASSPGCILKLREQMDKQGLDIKVMHPLELLDESLSG
jgi:glycolate oxidase iron-sulfur subunit